MVAILIRDNRNDNNNKTASVVIRSVDDCGCVRKYLVRTWNDQHIHGSLVLSFEFIIHW